MKRVWAINRQDTAFFDIISAEKHPEPNSEIIDMKLEIDIHPLDVTEL